MKNKGVCKGCRYHRVTTPDVYEKNTCCYCLVNGKSRLVIEMNNGGYKKDSCICYEPGKEIMLKYIPRSIKNFMQKW